MDRVAPVAPNEAAEGAQPAPRGPGRGVERIEFINGQRALLTAAIGRFARPGDPYALVDFPDHANVGDSAIWLGARAVLAGLTGRPPVHAGGPAGLARRIGAGTIYVNGGGNFGDLWPASQRLRERLLARFPDNRIVQLPQSIHFEVDEGVRRCAEAIRRHGDFHLLARDDASAAFARSRLACPVVLAPDCAFGLGPLAPPHPPLYPLHALLRDDKERSQAGRAAIEKLRPHLEDWVREPWRPVARARLALRADSLRARSRAGSAARPDLLDALARLRLDRGLALLSSGRQVVTDRLHGHILCLLLGIKHVALDNSYGKISAYHRTWTRMVDTGVFATDADQAAAVLAAGRP